MVEHGGMFQEVFRPCLGRCSQRRGTACGVVHGWKKGRVAGDQTVAAVAVWESVHARMNAMEWHAGWLGQVWG